MSSLGLGFRAFWRIFTGEDPEYVDQRRRQWYAHPGVKHKQRWSVVAASLHAVVSGLVAFPVAMVRRRSMMSALVGPLAAYNAAAFGVVGGVTLSLAGVTTYLGVQVRRASQRR